MAWRKFHNGDFGSFETDFFGRYVGLGREDVKLIANAIRQCCSKRNYSSTRAFIAKLLVSENEEPLQVEKLTEEEIVDESSRNVESLSAPPPQSQPQPLQPLQHIQHIHHIQPAQPSHYTSDLALAVMRYYEEEAMEMDDPENETDTYVKNEPNTTYIDLTIYEA